MNIDWGALGQVFVVGIGVTVGVVVLFSLGVNGLSAWAEAAGAQGTTGSGGRGSAGLVVAVLCFLACAVVVAYGIYVIVA